MKRIALSLFAITAVLAAGVAATGAYFEDTVEANNWTFTTGEADLDFGFCGFDNDCTGDSADIEGSYSFSTATDIGPGLEGELCMIVTNDGLYDLDLTAQLKVTAVTSGSGGLQDAMQIAAHLTGPGCGANNGWIFAPQSVRDAKNAGAVNAGSLAAGESTYIKITNSWDSTGNQNGLQNSTIKLQTLLTGRTA